MKQLLCLVLAGAAGAPLITTEMGQTSRFTTGVAAVRVDVLVTAGGRPVTGLTRSHFQLRDNGVEQAITDVSSETLPLNLICVLDVSGSVSGAPLANLKRAVTSLIDALGPEDRAALVTFAERVHLLSPLTGDQARLRGLVDDVKAGGNTSVIDAAFAGLALREADEGRTLMLLFSDGRDTASWLTARTVLESARRTDVVVYPISVRLTNTMNMSLPTTFSALGPSSILRRREPPSSVDNDELQLLDAFAEETGGRVFYADRQGLLEKTFLDVLTEFRQRYVLSYTPAGVPSEGWHTIDVKLRDRSGQVKSRRGYFASRASAARTK